MENIHEDLDIKNTQTYSLTVSSQKFNSVKEGVDWLFMKLPNRMRVAAPLGLGKPNPLINLFYDRVKNDETKSLTLYTALSLAVPKAEKDLEKKFLNPFLEKHFGSHYPQLEYLKDLASGEMPSRIQIREFYMQAGEALGSSLSQRSYVSLNYTHVAQDLVEQDIHAVVQMIAKKTVDGVTKYSLSCNPDVTLDLMDLYKKNSKKFLMIGVIHSGLPFMGGDAEVDEDFFDAVIEDAVQMDHELFALPVAPVDLMDHWIGFHASQLIQDDGTLQIGIGSLSDALVAATLMRHQQNELYQHVLQTFYIQRGEEKKKELHHDAFVKGLYGTSEMLMDGFMHLRRGGILHRQIFDLDESRRRYLHGAFFLGSKRFYQWLRDLNGEDLSGLGMTRVSKVNDLYDVHEMALRRQRRKARFFNTCMNVTLLGGAASDTLENGQVVSGVGGQYNFVAMSHELPDAHSILMLRSVRTDSRGKRISNIVTGHGHLTIPRHLRDVVVTEYGVAFLRGRSDEDVVKALLMITDSEFQNELMEWAKSNGKLASDYVLPSSALKNTPEFLKEISAPLMECFPSFPFGSDFTEVEENLALALVQLKAMSNSRLNVMKTFFRGLTKSSRSCRDEIERMDLGGFGFKNFFYRQLLVGILSK